MFHVKHGSGLPWKRSCDRCAAHGVQYAVYTAVAWIT